MTLDLTAWAALAGLVILSVGLLYTVICVVVVLWLAGAALVRAARERVGRPP